MIKELLAQQQPIVYQALENACLKNQISSAYLFCGPYGTPKKETAIFLAQSIFCDEGKLACESCNTCRRVKENTYSDLVILDGKEKPISKDDVDYIQEKFSKTALEKNGQRVYIILNVENASVAAQNSMLKFLEEPQAGITAILTTDNMNAVLPTILSRCTILPFVPMSQEAYQQMALDAKVKEEDIYFVSHIAKNMDDIDYCYPLVDEERKASSVFTNAQLMLKQYLNKEERAELLIDYEVSYRSKEKDTKKAKQENIAIIRNFLQFLMMYIHDCILQHFEGPSWYQNAVKNSSLSKEDSGKLLMIVSEQLDKVNRFNDLNLVMDQTFYKLEVFNNERK